MFIAIEDIKKKKNDDISNLLKVGTIYRNEKPSYKKYDFDGEKITATLYNKYCPSCGRYFHYIGKMAVMDIDKVILRLIELLKEKGIINYNVEDINEIINILLKKQVFQKQN